MIKYLSIMFFFAWAAVVNAQDSSSFSLEQALNFAAENSRKVQAVVYDLKGAEEKVKETTAIGLPQVNGSLSYQNYIKQPVSLVPAEFFGGPPGEFAELVFGTKHNAYGEVALNQLIFDGSYLVGLQSAKTYVQLTNDQKAKVQRDVRTEVEKAYYLVLVTREGKKILEESKEVLERILYETQQLLKEKMIDSTEVDQVKLLITNMENAINDAERREKIAASLLKFKMGIQMEREISLTDSLPMFLEQRTDQQILQYSLNVKSLIDYQLMETQQKAGELQVKFQKSKYLPSLGGFISHRENAFRNDFTFFSGDEKWFPTTVFGFSLQIPVFSGFARSARVQQAEISLEKTKLMTEQVEEGLKLQSITARADYATAYENFLKVKENLRLAERIRNKTIVKYREGVSGSLDLSQADNQYFTIQSQYIQSLYELLAARAELEKALGIQ